VLVEVVHPTFAIGQDIDEVEDLLAGAGDLDGNGDWLRHRAGS
jgi:hypothetical protein